MPIMGEDRAYVPIEDTRVFTQFLEVAGKCWNAVDSWPTYARDTVGKQLVRAIDSVGANLVEGDGRYRDTDALHFFVIASMSAREARYWLRIAADRHLVDQDKAREMLDVIETASRELNALIAYRRNHLNVGQVKDPAVATIADVDES